MGGYCADGEPVARFSTKTVRVKKARKCGDCDTPIAPGEQAVVTRYIFEGEWHGDVTCLACEAVFTYLWGKAAECLHHGGLGEYLGEMAPHDWLPGGEYEDCPPCPVVLKWREKCALLEAP